MLDYCFVFQQRTLSICPRPRPPTHDPNSSLSTLAGLLVGIRTEGSDLDFHGLDCGVKDDILMTGSQLHCVIRYVFYPC